MHLMLSETQNINFTTLDYKVSWLPCSAFKSTALEPLYSKQCTLPYQLVNKPKLISVQAIERQSHKVL